MGCLYHVCSILMVLWLVGRCNSLKRIWTEHGRALKTFCHGSWEKRRKLKRMKIVVEQSAPFWSEGSYACAMNSTHTVFIRIVERTIFHSTGTRHEQYTHTPWSLMKQYVFFAFQLFSIHSWILLALKVSMNSTSTRVWSLMKRCFRACISALFILVFPQCLFFLLCSVGPSK